VDEALLCNNTGSLLYLITTGCYFLLAHHINTAHSASCPHVQHCSTRKWQITVVT